MKEIFKQIKRFNQDIDFQTGEKFTINLTAEKQTVLPVKKSVANIMEIGHTYKIQVKKYMTEKSTPQFDFMTKWNNDIPMPLVIMTGKVVKQTRGMVQMELHGVAEETSVCMCCGRKLSNKISVLYGIGPECGEHTYINPFNSDEELEDYLTEVRSKISDITWSGWVIKSAIKNWEEVKE
jgi:hypothetical protein